MIKKQKLSSLFTFLACITFSGCGNSGSTAKNILSKNAGLYTADTKFNKLSKNDSAIYAAAIKKMYDSLLVNNGFNGAILVAKNGSIIFEEYRGYINFTTKDTITSHSPFHLASISKTFTGMAVLKLCEEKVLSLDDSVQKFFPAFPYEGITIKLLLSHRSGLPNYLYFMDSLWDKNKKATNRDVLNIMISHKPAIVWQPDTHFNYSNTNFMILALIIEKVTGQSYPDYMKKNVFLPLGMKDTYVFSMKDTARYVPTMSVSRIYPMDALDCTYGDKNIYSTPRDMLLWDKALYGHTYVTKASLDMAFTPQSNENEGKRNYGLAWRMIIDAGDTLIYHNGNWHGSNTVFSRLIQDTATIIVLGNKENRNIYRSKMMSSVFNGKISDEKTEE